LIGIENKNCRNCRASYPKLVARRRRKKKADAFLIEDAQQPANVGCLKAKASVIAVKAKLTVKSSGAMEVPRPAMAKPS